MHDIRKSLLTVLGKSNHWAEIRYHHRTARNFAVRKGEVSEMSTRQFGGVGIRVLIAGTWGFASTSDLSLESLEKTLKIAEFMAGELKSRKKHKVTLAKSSRMATQDFTLPGFIELGKMPLEEKFNFVKQTEERLRNSSQQVETASCSYSEVFEDKIIITTDGANTHVRLVRPELRFLAFGADGTKKTMGYDSVGGTGGWNCLFQNRTSEQFVENAVKNAIDLLKAPSAEGGKKKVILSPALVGILSHEAIGHTVEADFVNAGSVAKGKIGHTVASSLITLCDSGFSEHTPNAGGVLPVDDEGVLTERTVIINQGKLASYLHSRESAHEYGVEPTGNGRAWEFSDEPLIRMRNTYIEPGTSNLEDMINGVEDGYFVDGPQNGQADATAEFMFAASRIREIKNGKLGKSLQGITITGNAFDVLKSVDAVSKDFQWDLGSGHCGKGQPAKVDAGGPYLRCEVLVGGAQK
jgi:TldD protein